MQSLSGSGVESSAKQVKYMTNQFLKAFQKQYFKGSKEINKPTLYTAKGFADLCRNQ